MSRMNRTIAMAAAIAVPLAACGQGGETRDGTIANVAQPATAARSDRLLTAAEPFEKLTETAFTASAAALGTSIGEARTAANGVRDIIDPAKTGSVDNLLADLDRHRQDGNRANIALASIEIYRILVSTVPAGTKVPSAVSLLDYAGFRYQADLKARPVRWEDMAGAMRVAHSQWATVSPQLSSVPLRATFEASLRDMEKAIAARNVAAADQAVTRELDLVDQLEAYFNQR